MNCRALSRCPCPLHQARGLRRNDRRVKPTASESNPTNPIAGAKGPRGANGERGTVFRVQILTTQYNCVAAAVPVLRWYAVPDVHPARCAHVVHIEPPRSPTLERWRGSVARRDVWSERSIGRRHVQGNRALSGESSAGWRRPETRTRPRRSQVFLPRNSVAASSRQAPADRCS